MKINQPSATAALILKVVLFNAYDHTATQMVAPDTVQFSQLIANKVFSFPKLLTFFFKNRISRGLLMSLERVLNPGFILHVVTRKKYIEKLSHDAVHHGYHQVIVIGAGYDTLAIKMAKQNKLITCFEVDHPNTQELKRQALESIATPNFHLIPADLSIMTISAALQQNKIFAATKKTLIVIEGVLMYLHEDKVEQLLKELYTLFPNGLNCIFSFMEKRQNGDIQFKIAHPMVKWWLTKKHEQFLWGIAKNELLLKMKHIGFSRIRIIDKNDFIEEYFRDIKPTPKLAEGEMICSIIK